MLVGFHSFIDYWRETINECCKDKYLTNKENNLKLFKTLQQLTLLKNKPSEFISSHNLQDFEQHSFISDIITHKNKYKITSFDKRKTHTYITPYYYPITTNCIPNKKNPIEYCKKSHIEIVAIKTPYKINSDNCLYTTTETQNHKKYFVKNNDFITIIDKDLLFYQLVQEIFFQFSRNKFYDINAKKFIMETNELYKKLAQKTL